MNLYPQNNTSSSINIHTKKSHEIGLGIGSASILIIFVILCLISFAALSISSATADNRLTKKVLERTTAYYEACNTAEASLAAIGKTLLNVYNTSANEEVYFATVGHEKSYAIEISDTQTLHVVIEILYPINPDDTFYRITNWQVIKNPKAPHLGVLSYI